jgi:hypothetical protein
LKAGGNWGNIWGQHIYKKLVYLSNTIAYGYISVAAPATRAYCRTIINIYQFSTFLINIDDQSSVLSIRT